MNRIKNIYWEFFFSVYFLMSDLGEKETPEWNASGIIEFLFAFVLLGGVLYLNALLGGNLPFIKFWIFAVIIFSVILNGSIIRSKKKGYKKHIAKYEYLSKQSAKKKRNQKVLFVVISIFLFLISSFLITNPHIRTFLF